MVFKMNRQKPSLGGFTLVELMIVVAIIAILSSIALPAYQNYIRESRRVDAQATLHDLQQRQEKHRISNPSYTTDLTALGFVNPSSYYDFSVALSGTGYTLSAKAKTGTTQASDTGCTDMTLNQNSTGAPATCWKK